MATHTASVPFDNSTLANFKAWAQAVGVALAALGWVQTSDTGQVNWSTISTVPANGATTVYEVWKSNGPISATLPIVMRIDYMNSSGGANMPAIGLVIGTGSNGTGTITGGGSITAIQNGVTAQGGTLFPCFFSGDADEFRMYMWQSASLLSALTIVIERSKDATGANTADYFSYVYAPSSGSSGVQQSILLGSVTTAKKQLLGAINADTGLATGAFNGSTAALPVFPIVGKVGNPMLGLMTLWAADSTDAAIITVATMYSATHTYICCRSNGTFTNGAGSFTAATLLAMRYE